MERERKKVMVVIDESKESYYTLLWAIDNIHEILGSQQLVIFAAETPPTYNNNVFAASLSSAPLYSTVISTQDFAKSMQEIEKKVAIGLLEKAKSVCSSRGIIAETILEEGDAKVAICDAVKEHKINILVIAEQHIGRVKGLFSWSVSDYCIQYAKCPVLVVKKYE